MGSSSYAPRIQVKIAAGTIVQYTAVKYSTDDEHIVEAAAGEEAIGIAQSAGASGTPIEVAMPGGGGLWLCGGTIGLGLKLCKVTTAGKALVATDGSWAVGLVDSKGVVSGDVAAVFVMPQFVGATQT